MFQVTLPDVETVLISDRTAPRGVRAIVARTLERWDVPGLTDDAQYIADEIVTNAIVHGALPARFWMYIHDGQLVLEVTDSSPTLPVPRDADSDDEDGRGFTIVDALATAWGVEALQCGIGKKVWATLTIQMPAIAPLYADFDDPPTVVLERVAA